MRIITFIKNIENGLELLDRAVALDPIRDGGSLIVHGSGDGPVQLQLCGSHRVIRISSIGNIGNADADIQVEGPHDRDVVRQDLDIRQELME